jgi:hypothetical protein
MNKQEPTQADARRKFVGVLKAVEEFCNIQGQRQLPLKDATSLDSDEISVSLTTISNQGKLLVRGSVEHLLAFSRCLEDPALSIAPYACIRASLESSAIAVWLSDQRVDRKERIARSFAFRFEGLRQQEKSNKDPAIAAQIQNRIGEIESKAVSLGYSRLRDPKNDAKIVNIGRPWPGITAIARDALNSEPLYRLLSAVAHAHPWAISRASYRRTSSPNILEQHLDPRFEDVLRIAAATSLASAVWNVFEFAGVDSASTTNLLSSLCDEMGFTKRRFWILNKLS